MRNTAFLVLALSLSLQAQTKIDLAKQATNADFSAFSATRPAKVGTSLPTCSGSGWLYFKSDATAGRNLYGCVSGTWYQLGGAPSVAWGDITGVPSTFPPSAHASAHLSGGGDALSLTVAEIASGSKTGAGTRVAMADGVPTDGCTYWESGVQKSTGTPCGAGGGTTTSVAYAEQSFTSQTSVTVTHNFNSLLQTWACRDGSAVRVEPNSVTAGLSTTVFTFSGSQTGTCSVWGGTGLYSEAFTGQTSVNLDHDFNTTAIDVRCYDGSNVAVEPDSWMATDANNATVTFASAQTGYCAVGATLALTGGGGGGGGSVTSVGLTLPSEFSVSGSPVTGAGTLAGSWASQTAGKVLAAPAGSTGTPSFRVLAQSDLPTMTGDSGSGGVKGAVPAPAAGDAAAGKYLKADGTWAVPPGGGGGGTYTAGDGISIVSSVVSVDATVPAIAVSGSQSLTFGTINAGSCSVQTITATGATAGDGVVPGYPATLPDGVIGIMHVTATNTVSVRLCKITTGAADVTGLTFTYQIIRGR